MRGYTGKGWVSVYNISRCEEHCKCKVKKRGKRAGLARLGHCSPVAGKQFCRWEMMIFKSGDTFNDNGNVCTCNCDGELL